MERLFNIPHVIAKILRLLPYGDVISLILTCKSIHGIYLDTIDEGEMIYKYKRDMWMSPKVFKLHYLWTRIYQDINLFPSGYLPAVFEISNGDIVISLSDKTLLVERETGELKATMDGGTYYPMLFDDEKFYWLRGTQQDRLDKWCSVVIYDKTGKKENLIHFGRGVRASILYDKSKKFYAAPGQRHALYSFIGAPREGELSVVQKFDLETLTFGARVFFDIPFSQLKMNNSVAGNYFFAFGIQSHLPLGCYDLRTGDLLWCHDPTDCRIELFPFNEHEAIQAWKRTGKYRSIRLEDGQAGEWIQPDEPVSFTKYCDQFGRCEVAMAIKRDGVYRFFAFEESFDKPLYQFYPGDYDSDADHKIELPQTVRYLKHPNLIVAYESLRAPFQHAVFDLKKIYNKGPRIIDDYSMPDDWSFPIQDGFIRIWVHNYELNVRRERFRLADRKLPLSFRIYKKKTYKDHYERRKKLNQQLSQCQ